MIRTSSHRGGRGDGQRTATAARLAAAIARTRVSEIQAADGTRLALREWEVPDKTEERGAVLLVHGFGENTVRYPHVAEAFTQAGLRVAGFDLRGHGQSGGRRGDVANYRMYLDDIETVAAHFGVGRGWVVFGHSLGGQMLWYWLAQTGRQPGGAVIASPWFALSKMPSRAKILLAHLLEQYAPQFRQAAGGKSTAHLSRDQEFLRALPGKPLSHRTMSVRMYLACSRAAAGAGGVADAIRVPLWMPHGAEDSLTCPAGTMAVAARLRGPDQHGELIPGALHELHNDAGRDAYLLRTARWLAGHA